MLLCTKIEPVTLEGSKNLTIVEKKHVTDVTGQDTYIIFFRGVSISQYYPYDGTIPAT